MNNKQMKIFTLLLLLIISGHCYCQSINYNEEFKLTDVENSASQRRTSLAELTNNRFVLVWTTYGYVYGQIYNHNGIKIANEFSFHLNAPTMFKVDVSGLANGGFVVCWEQSGIFFRLYDQNGLDLGTKFQVNNNENNHHRMPTVCGLSNGGFVVVWECDLDASGYGIYAKIYDENGTQVGEEFPINSYTKEYQVSASTTSLNDGGFVVCWDSFEQDGSGYGIFGQFFNHLGHKIGTEFQVNSFTHGEQSNSKVQELSNTDIVITYQSKGQDGSNYGIFFQRFDKSGDRKGMETQVNTYTWDSQYEPRACGLSRGGFLICWESRHQDESSYGIFAQLFDENGVTIGSEFQVNTFSENSQFSPSICEVGDDQIMVCWLSVSQEVINRANAYGKFFQNKPINHEFTDFQLLYPAFDSSLDEINPKFKWNRCAEKLQNFPWEYTYALYIDKDPAFSNPMIIRGIQDTFYRMDSLLPGETYFWHVFATTYLGEKKWSSNVNGFYIDPDAVTNIAPNIDQVSNRFVLHQNYPNPFNPITQIKYSLPSNKSDYHVTIKIYDVLGRLVAVLFDNYQNSGSYKIDFNGETLSTGIYYYTVTADNFSMTKKMILMK